MAVNTYLETWFIIPSVAIWSAVFLACLFDGLRHRFNRSRGWQLYACVTLVMATMTLRYTLLLLYSLAESYDTVGAGALFYSYILVTDLADALFIVRPGGGGGNGVGDGPSSCPA